MINTHKGNRQYICRRADAEVLRGNLHGVKTVIELNRNRPISGILAATSLDVSEATVDIFMALKQVGTGFVSWLVYTPLTMDCCFAT